MHGSIFSSGRNSGSCDDFRAAECWRVVPQGNGSRHLRSKVVKVVCFEFFFLSAYGFRLGLQNHHGEAGASCASDGGKARCLPGGKRAFSRRLVGFFLERRLNSLGSVLWILRSGYRVFHPGGSAGSGRTDEEAVLSGTRGFHHAGRQTFFKQTWNCSQTCARMIGERHRTCRVGGWNQQWQTLLMFLQQSVGEHGDLKLGRVTVGPQRFAAPDGVFPTLYLPSHRVKANFSYASMNATFPNESKTSTRFQGEVIQRSKDACVVHKHGPDLSVMPGNSAGSWGPNRGPGRS